MTMAAGSDSGATRLWQALGAMADSDLPLLEGAFLIARDEYPRLSVPEYSARLQRFAAAAREALADDAEPPRQVRVLNRVLFDEAGLRGSEDDYYDPRNSYLNEVLDRRLGIPISLSVIYVEVARRAGLEAHGIGFPGHFLVRVGPARSGLIVDPFHRGVILEAAQLSAQLTAADQSSGRDKDQLEHLLSPAGSRSILVRMLRNLKAIYLARRDAPRALRTTDRIVALLPQYAPEYRDRGELYHQLDVPHAALADFRRYLELAPEADDAAGIRERIDILQDQAGRLH